MAIAPQSKFGINDSHDEPMLFDEPHDVEHMLEACPVADDFSQTEDLIVRRSPAAAIIRQNETPERSDSKPPHKIGHGRLVRAKPTWKPGDPFGQAAVALTHDFDWPQVARMAFMTVVLGAFAIWILNVLFGALIASYL